jgi:hypothetical protein
MDIRPEMKIGIEKSKKVWRTYSRSNRALDLPETDFRLILYDSLDNPIMPVKGIESDDEAKTEQQKISEKLGIELKG